MKKSIWIQIFSYKPNTDAAANRAIAFANYFSLNGFKVNIITNGRKNEVEYDGTASIYRVKNIFHYKRKTTINRYIDNWLFGKGVKRIIRKNKDQMRNSIYLASSPELLPSKSGLLAKKYGAVFIFDVRDIWPEVAVQMNAFTNNSLFAKIFRKTANFMYKKSDLITTVGKKKTEYLQAYDNNSYCSKVKYICNGIDLDDLVKELDYSVIDNYTCKSNKIVSYVGNVGAAQGLDTFLDLAREHSELLFLICGHGKDLERLKEIVLNDKLDNVYFTGTISKNQALAVTKKSYISFISLLSSKMVDSIPTKLYESLGLGTPTFLVASGESCEILEECKLGEYAKPGFSEEISSKFNKLLENYDSIKSYSSHSISIIKSNYSRQSACAQLLEIIEKEFDSK